jgi:hypothetical protein
MPLLGLEFPVPNTEGDDVLNKKVFRPLVIGKDRRRSRLQDRQLPDRRNPEVILPNDDSQGS